MKKNSLIITNAEFNYYKTLCNSQKPDEQREGLQSLIREHCQGRILMNSQRAYLEKQLPFWILSPSNKVRMWSLWLATLVNNAFIEEVIISTLNDERDPQNISAILAMLSTHHEQREFLQIVRKLENTAFKVELNEDILKIATCLFSKKQYYKVSQDLFKSFLNKENLLKWGSIWLPIFFAYPYLVKTKGLSGLVTCEHVSEFLKIDNPRINEYALWCMSLNGSVGEKQLPIKKYDYDKLHPGVMKWYLQIILKDPDGFSDIDYILHILNNIYSLETDTKEGLLHGMSNIAYCSQFVPYFVKWYFSETNAQIKRLLLIRMITNIEADLENEGTYYEIIADEFYGNGDEKNIIEDYIAAMGINSAIYINKGRLLLSDNLDRRRIIMQAQDTIFNGCHIENLQINNESGNSQYNHCNEAKDSTENMINLLIEINKLEKFSLSEELHKQTKAIKEEIQVNKSGKGIKNKLLDYSSILSNAITISGALPEFINIGKTIIELIKGIA